MPESRPPAAIRLIGLLEALKGLLALASAAGLLSLLHDDIHAWALQLVAHLHLNPAAHYPRVIIAATEHLDDHTLLAMAVGAVGYGVLRVIEGYGLYRERAWAEWLAALSGLFYVPFEIIELFRGQNGLALAALVVNLLVVAIMAGAIRQRRHAAVAGGSGNT